MAYTIFGKLETGEPEELETFETLEQAERLAKIASECWPGDYSVKKASSTPEVLGTTTGLPSQAPSKERRTAQTMETSPSPGDDWETT